MRSLVTVLTLCLITLVALCQAAEAGDWPPPPFLVQTGCELVSTDPLLFRAHFTLMNRVPLTEPIQWAVDQIQIRPVQDTYPGSDTCFALACDSPPDWICGAHATEGVVIWSTHPERGVGPEQTLAGFAVTFGSPSCCYRVAYRDQPFLEAFYWETLCFDCSAVPTHRPTWGGVKAVYR